MIGTTVLAKGARRVAVGAAFWFCNTASFATPVFESAADAGTGCSVGGRAVDAASYVAARFSLANTTQINGLGGRVCGFPGLDSSLFVAIVPLATPTSLPTSTPSTLAGEALFSGVFTAPSTSGDVFAPASFSLAAGDYAIVMGSELFGATGTGYLPDDNSDFASSSYFFAADDGQGFTAWTDGIVANVRLVVNGVPTVSEPGAIFLLFAGLIALCGGRTLENSRGRRVPGGAIATSKR